MRRRTEVRPDKGKRTAILGVTLVAALAALTAAPAAQAGPLVASAGDCSTAPAEQPFLPWADPSQYVQVSNGGFERGASGWSLAGAGVVAGNEPYYVHGANESRSLSVPSGASATSDTTNTVAHASMAIRSLISVQNPRDTPVVAA